ncbi:MAG: hypothetical protein KGH59_00355 [Candidatus Micrarchaeota archaeon]|nr:hypothetical protein [Candidatus Micrarchaeota archaeon]MDE1804225.1 hypothetical protein [Candidatus Micrarchaeota archaeon]
MIAKLPKDTDALGILAALLFGVFSYIYVFRPIFSLGFVPVSIFNTYISNILPLALLALFTISGAIYFARREQFRPITHHFRVAFLMMLFIAIDGFSFVMFFMLPYYPGRVLFIFLNLMFIAFINKHFLDNMISAVILLLFTLPFIWIMLIQVQSVPQGHSSQSVPCIVSPGFVCANPSLATNGNLSIVVGQKTGPTLYSIALGCASVATVKGLPNPANAIVYLAASGAPSSTSAVNGTLGPFSIANGNEIMVRNLKCYGIDAMPIENISSGSTYSGSIWMSYSVSNNASNAQIFTRRIGIISVQVS